MFLEERLIILIHNETRANMSASSDLRTYLNRDIAKDKDRKLEK